MVIDRTELQLRNSDQMFDAEGRAARRAGATYDFDVISGGDDAVVRDCEFTNDLRIGASRVMLLDNRWSVAGDIVITSSSTDSCLAHNYVPLGSGAVTDGGTGTQYGTNFSDAGTW